MKPSRKQLKIALLACIFFVTVTACFAQRGGWGRGRRQPVTRDEFPSWTIDEEFPHDAFTFARIQFNSVGRGRDIGSWDNDYPDCDWNFSLRLHQLTSMPINPNGIVLRLTDSKLMDYPFIYFSNAQKMHLSDDEVKALHEYLMNGGFMMVDDIWSIDAINHVLSEMNRVLPDQQPEELPLSHELFHSVYDLKEMPQVPSILAWQRGEIYEDWHDGYDGYEPPQFFGYHDNSGRLVALICHNNDIGDGWEREGENKEYFERYSVKISYPLGVNIVTYAMTH